MLRVEKHQNSTGENVYRKFKNSKLSRFVKWQLSDKMIWTVVTAMTIVLQFKREIYLLTGMRCKKVFH